MVKVRRSIWPTASQARVKEKVQGWIFCQLASRPTDQTWGDKVCTQQMRPLHSLSFDNVPPVSLLLQNSYLVIIISCINTVLKIQRDY